MLSLLLYAYMGLKIFQKYGTHLRILGDRSVTCRLLHTESPHFCEWYLNLAVIRHFLVSAYEHFCMQEKKCDNYSDSVWLCCTKYSHPGNQVSGVWLMYVQCFTYYCLSNLYRSMFKGWETDWNAICYYNLHLFMIMLEVCSKFNSWMYSITASDLDYLGF